MRESVFTILGGVSIFVIGQFILKLVLDPIVDFKLVLGDVSAIFLREQARITNKNASIDTQEELKHLSSSILAKKQAIPFYRCVAFIFRLPSKKSLTSACGSLNLIATNILPKPDNYQESLSERSTAHITSAVITSDKIFLEMMSIQKELGIIVAYG